MQGNNRASSVFLVFALSAGIVSGQTSVVNAASFASTDPLAPGSFATIFGQNLCGQTAGGSTGLERDVSHHVGRLFGDREWNCRDDAVRHFRANELRRSSEHSIRHGQRGHQQRNAHGNQFDARLGRRGQACFLWMEWAWATVRWS